MSMPLGDFLASLPDDERKAIAARATELRTCHLARKDGAAVNDTEQRYTVQWCFIINASNLPACRKVLNHIGTALEQDIRSPDLSRYWKDASHYRVAFHTFLEADTPHAATFEAHQICSRLAVPLTVHGPRLGEDGRLELSIAATHGSTIIPGIETFTMTINDDKAIPEQDEPTP